ncbi:MAG: hypothetical protein ABI977_05040 [Acidobacteriota bacterium]
MGNRVRLRASVFLLFLLSDSPTQPGATIRFAKLKLTKAELLQGIEKVNIIRRQYTRLLLKKNSNGFTLSTGSGFINFPLFYMEMGEIRQARKCIGKAREGRHQDE